MAKLNVKALGLAFGVVWSALILITGITSMLFDWGTLFVDVFSNIYFGYAASILGSLIGGAWGFFDGFLCGVVVAWLYNKFSK